LLLKFKSKENTLKFNEILKFEFSHHFFASFNLVLLHFFVSKNQKFRILIDLVNFQGKSQITA